MAVVFSLAALPVKFVAIPVMAGLAAGTGAVAAYVRAPAPATTAAVVVPATPAPIAKRSCEQATWPYIDDHCIRRGDAPARQVRLVMAPRAGEVAPNAATVPALVTSNTVLRGPGVAPEVNEPAVKKPSKRSETRRQRGQTRNVQTLYSGPSAQGTQPAIVVRPLRLNSYSSRF